MKGSCMLSTDTIFLKTIKILFFKKQAKQKTSCREVNPTQCQYISSSFYAIKIAALKMWKLTLDFVLSLGGMYIIIHTTTPQKQNKKIYDRLKLEK